MNFLSNSNYYQLTLLQDKDSYKLKNNNINNSNILNNKIIFNKKFK